MNPIYLDYNATTPLDHSVVEEILPFLKTHFGNPSSGHAYGQQVARAIMQAREKMADLLHCSPDEIIFTSGGTEANNIAIQGVAFANQHKGKHLITSTIEHLAVTEVYRFLESRGYEITFIPVDDVGQVNLEELSRAIRSETILISIMHANNETGTIQPVEEIGRIARQAGVLFHSDAAQSVGKIPVDVMAMGVSLLSVAGHKIYAPKGIGALYIRRGTILAKRVFGADHEFNRRPGTPNVSGIVGIGKAAEIISSSQSALMEGDPACGQLQGLRDLLHNGIREKIPGVRLNGHRELRLPNTLSLGFPGVEANLLLQAMKGVAASAGAACHTGSEEVSGVLAAMRVPPQYAMGTVRFSIGRMTTEEEIRTAIPIIVNAYKEIQGSSILPLTANLDDIRLTDFSHALGCACKIRPQALEELLSVLSPVTDSRVVVGMETRDDASVFQLNEFQALVQTVDFIPPIVDDPFYYGAIAASNALSDIYAMGAKPLYALNLVGFPENRLPVSLLGKILKGAEMVAREAGIAIVGGHSIETTEPFFGLSVTGIVDPARVIRNRGIQSGDALILTKPLGTGILTTALKQRILNDMEIQPLMETMRKLNQKASACMMRYPVHACTDVTGFGLMGHLREMIQGEAVNVEVEVASIPLMPKVRSYLAMGALPGGTRTNLAYIQEMVEWGDHMPELERLLLCDAQTSGGLMIALPEKEAVHLLAELKDAGLTEAALIGRAVTGMGKILIQPEPRS